MKQSSICWLSAFFACPVILSSILWLGPSPLSEFLSKGYFSEGGVSVFVVMYLLFYCLGVLGGYFLKSTIAEDIFFVNNQYFLQNKELSDIKAVKIETRNSERKYYVYGAKNEAPTIFSYYSEGFIRGTWSGAKTPEGKMIIILFFSLFLTYCIIAHFGNESLSYLQYCGVFLIFLYLKKKYTVLYTDKKNVHILKCKNNLYIKNNLCYIIKKDSLEKYEEKFNIKDNLFHIIENNGDYILYYSK